MRKAGARPKTASATDAAEIEPFGTAIRHASDDEHSTRGRILTAAERLFAGLGYSGVSMPMIADASGITAGAIYKHFESKEDLFFEVIRHAVQAVPQSVDGAAPQLSGVPGIVALYTTERLRLLRQLAVEVHHASGRHPRVRRLLRRSLDKSLRLLRDSLASAQRTGEVEAGPDPTLLASLTLVLIMGLMHMETLLPDLVGDAKWHDFVRARAALLLGLQERR